MTDLKIIENELVPVYETSTGEKVINGRELYEVLESKQDFSTWVKKRLNECDTIENTDYTTAPQNYGTANGGYATRLEYIIKLDIAKEMAMLERNQKGKEVRKYFIEIEKKYKQKQSILSTTDEKSKLTEAKLINAKVRMSNQLLKLSYVDTLSTEYKNILVSKATEVLTGEQLIPLPKSKQKTYSATEIGEMFGVSKQKIGLLSNKFKLKIEQYGEWYRSKSEHSSKEVDTWVYYDSVIPVFKELLNVEVGAFA